MTLIQKLNDSIITNINIVESENRMCYDYNHLELAESCEVIADEFAIGFADWVRVCKLKQRPYDFENIKELLEIYKKEKLL
ncbi:hypothetical protein UFOVP299_26 [uncultured Caudovirales phage]|uniref:Uncharacterized protein n=1 Tax=uncultured Caudovirales phage TaxID=2100421 RepID=A0A6J5LPF2_9CAUD|nr:hypothetical protein UFOVP299_26 [uncultured Caudovirales phage]